MLTRTWRYGTRLKATVKEVAAGADPLRPRLTMLESGGEAFILAQTRHAIEPKVGATVEMEFLEGGPTGGYWRIIGAA